MPRGYRCVLLAALGWLIIAATSVAGQAQREQPETQQEIANALSDIATALKDANKRPDPNQPCDSGTENRKSDLCAQWKAADAADEAATYTRKTYFLGIGGLVVGFLTLAAAAAAAYFARDAARHTEAGAKEAQRGADAAEAGLELANKTAEIQLRAYIRCAAETFTRDPNDSGAFTFKLPFENVGQTPARHVAVYALSYFETFKHVVPYGSGGGQGTKRIIDRGVSRFGTVSRDSDFILYGAVKVSAADVAKIEKRRGVLHYRVNIHYTDEFDVKWTYAHDFFLNAHALSIGGIHTTKCETYKAKKDDIHPAMPG